MGENTQAIEDLLLLAQEQEEKLDYKNQEIRRLEKEICDLQDQILFYKKELEKECHVNAEWLILEILERVKPELKNVKIIELKDKGKNI